MEQLRTLARDALAKGLHDSALFFAQRLTAHQHATTDDLFLLVQALLFAKQYRRALHHLLHHPARAPLEPRFVLLTARCHAHARDWDSCLAALDDAALERAVAAETAVAEAEQSEEGLLSRFAIDEWFRCKQASQHYLYTYDLVHKTTTRDTTTTT